MSGRAGKASAPRAQLLVILLIALASLGGSYLLFYMASHGEPWATSNRGAFVDPPRNAADLGLTRSGGGAFAPEGSWWLWVVVGGPCRDACEAALHQVRQVHVLLNRDAHRVRRALVAESTSLDPTLLERFARLELVSGNLGRLEEGIYLIDPLGNLVLKYALEDAGRPVLEDLKRLLKVSQIG